MPIYNLNKSTENLFIKIKTKIWWLLLGVLIFCILWGKKLSLLWQKNITEGHNTMKDEESDEESDEENENEENEEDGEDKNTILQIISNKNTRLSDSLPATETSSGSRPPARTPSAGSRTPASTTSSGSTTPAPTNSSGSRTPAPTNSSGSTTPAPTNSAGSTTPASTTSSGSTTPAPTNSSGGGSGGGGGGGGSGGSNSTCPPSKWKINDKVQIIKPNNAPAVPGTIRRVDLNSTGCVYSYMVQLCDDSTNTYLDSDLVSAPPPGSAPNSCNSNGDRGQNVVTLTTSPVPSGTTSAPSARVTTSNSCNEFTVMVTNGKREGESWSYSTNGNRGSIPCPLDSLLQTVDNSPLPGWVCTDAIVVDNANKVLFDRSTCADKQTSDEKWSYSESTKKATVKIPMTDTITTYANSQTHSIFLTYVPKVSVPSPTPST